MPNRTFAGILGHTCGMYNKYYAKLYYKFKFKGRGNICFWVLGPILVSVISLVLLYFIQEGILLFSFVCCNVAIIFNKHRRKVYMCIVSFHDMMRFSSDVFVKMECKYVQRIRTYAYKIFFKD